MVARKHGGGAGEGGFSISMPTLFEKSGAEGAYRRFKFEIAKIAERDPLPGYTLLLEQPQGKREPSLRMSRRSAEAPRASNDAPTAKVGIPPKVAALNGAKPSTRQSPATDPQPLLDAGDVIRRTVTSLSSRATAGELTDATLATLRTECPGWDYQSLHQDFRNWLDADPTRTPVNYQKAFIGFVRRFHEKNRHRL